MAVAPIQPPVEPPVELGPAEPEPGPLVPVKAENLELPWSGARVPYGRARRGPRPSAPGRRGDLLVTIDSPYQIFGRSSTYVHVSAHRKNGAPARGARVFINRKGVGTTDASGTLVFRYKRRPTKKDANRWDTDSLFVVDRGGRCGAVKFQPYDRTPSFASDHLFVYTDRGVFRPGETVHVRTIGWRLRQDYSPLADADIELLLRDNFGHTITAAEARTDDFGVASTDLRIPLTADTGNYRLRVSYGEERASTRLQVRRFDPPTMRIEHTLPRFVTRDQATLDFTVSAHPTSGGELGPAKLRAQARDPSGAVVAELERSVSKSGPHRFSFSAEQIAKLLGATKEGQLATIRIRVADELGRKELLVRELRVTSNPYVAILELDRDDYSTGDPVTVVARISDRDQVPVRNRAVRLRIDKLGKSLEAETDQGGMAVFRFSMPEREQDLALSIPGVSQPVAETILPWIEPRPMRPELPDPVVRERQTTKVLVKFPAGYVPAEKAVHMDVTDTSGAVVGTKLLPIRTEAGKPVARGEFKAPSWGSMLLTFFALGHEAKVTKTKPANLGLLIGGQTLVVQTDRELEIELHGVPKSARPGDPLRIEARVKDAQGRPAEVEVGAAVVDRAVLALKDPLEITPMDKFYNPRLRTLSTTGSEILTWPVVTRNWGEAQMDVALPPFPWLGGGAVENCQAHWDERDYIAAKVQKPSVGFGSGSGKGYGGGGGRGRAKKVNITIRTRFPDTSLWEPHLRGRGTVAIKGRLPDTIGEQELIVVASDKAGGVGMVRQPIAVRTPVFVQPELPFAAVAGERIQLPVVVHNRSGHAAQFAVALEGAGGVEMRKLQVANDDAAATLMPFSPTKTGLSRVKVRATGAGHEDRVVREVRVVPRGVPIETRHQGTVTKAKPLELAFEVPRGASGHDAHLRVDFPAVTTAFLGLDELAASVADDPWWLASDLTSAVLALELAKRHKIRSIELESLRTRVLAAMTLISRVQQHNGLFAYWRNGRASPFVTARVLEGLLEAGRTGFPVPTRTIARAADALAVPLSKGKLVEVDDIGWWEGKTEAVREGLTAEIFDVLSRVPKKDRSQHVRDALGALEGHYRKYLERSDPEPLAGGRGLSALIRLGAISKKDARRIAANLIAQRDEGHWEPTWFHAYGGTVEATVAVLEALSLADPRGFATEKRDALKWVLATRRAWGMWHNETGTAAAIRALHLVGAAPRETASTVTVELDGRPLTTVRVDPKDPLKSTLELAHLDLGSLRAGKHALTVRYDGQLAPAVTIVSRVWQPGKSGAQSRNGVRLTAKGPSKVAAGAKTTLVVEASGKQARGGRVVIGTSGLLEVDMAELGKRIGRGHPIHAIRATDAGIELTLAPEAKRAELSVPLVAVRRGTGRLPTVALFGRRGAVVVDPGAVKID